MKAFKKMNVKVHVRKPEPMSWSRDSEQLTRKRNIPSQLTERKITRGISLVATESIVFQFMFSISISGPLTRISNINSPGHLINTQVLLYQKLLCRNIIEFSTLPADKVRD